MAKTDPVARNVPSGSLWIITFLRDFLRAAFNPYHPEEHYMRGPGPACAAKRNVVQVTSH